MVDSPLISPAQIFSAHIVAELAAWGRNFWLAPGARSQALAIACAQVAEVGGAQLFVRIDERSLGFSALGAAVYGGPQVIITTSGTAVANLHPAVLEAHHSGLGLILLTADRPAELRGKGSNQTTNQVGIFADAVIECIDVPAPTIEDIPNLPKMAKDLVEKAVLLAWGKRAQPVQLNLQFSEPLSAALPNAADILGSLSDAQIDEVLAVDSGEYQLDASVPTVVVAGANSGEFSQEIADLNLPVLAEPSSGVRHLANSILGYRFLLATDAQLVKDIRQVIVYGKPTLSRPVIALLKRSDVKVFVRESQMGPFGIGSSITQVTERIVTNGDASLVSKWHEEATKLIPVASNALDRRALVESTWAQSKVKDSILVLGASQLIREADFYAPGTEVRVWANRGLSGIDGTIATATGIALSEPDKKVRALMGDLTFLHDVGSLAIDPEDGELDLQIIVGNDRGGKIFSNLEVKSTVETNMFRRIFETPQTAKIKDLASAYGWKYLNPKSVHEYENALGESGRVIIEVNLD